MYPEHKISISWENFSVVLDLQSCSLFCCLLSYGLFPCHDPSHSQLADPEFVQAQHVVVFPGFIPVASPAATRSKDHIPTASKGMCSMISGALYHVVHTQTPGLAADTSHTKTHQAKVGQFDCKWLLLANHTTIKLSCLRSIHPISTDLKRNSAVAN